MNTRCVRIVTSAVAVVAMLATMTNPGLATGRELHASGVGAAPQQAPAPGSLFAGRFDVGGRSLFIRCSGAGTVTVILDAQIGAASDSWFSVIPGLEPLTRVCAYDRANLGQSDPLAGTRTAQDMAGDLHLLLDAAHIEQPYILVGHGVGGYNARLYQQMWPSEVFAVVLIGVDHPDYITRQKQALPMTLGADPEALEAIVKWMDLRQTKRWYEQIDLTASGAQFKAATQGGAVLKVIAQPPFGPMPSFQSVGPIETADNLVSQYYAMQRELAAGGSLIDAQISGSDLPNQAPALVIKVIAEALRASAP